MWASQFSAQPPLCIPRTDADLLRPGWVKSCSPREQEASLTQAGGVEVRREEDSGEADEGRHAGGILAIPLAVLVEDVDFGRLEPDAGVDLDHAAGPAVGTRDAS